MIVAACDWNQPGQARYTGTAASAIHAFADIPQPTRDDLIAKWERRDIADSVVIDRDSIRGQAHEYSPVIRSMHFGSAGKQCATVTRAGWTPEHVETALVICSGAYCVALPAICGNWFVITRNGAPRETPGGPGFVPVMPIGWGPVLPPAFGVPYVPAPALPAVPGAPGYPGAPGIPDASFGGGFSTLVVESCCDCLPVPIAPIPEPHEYALMLSGLALIGWKAKRA